MKRLISGALGMTTAAALAFTGVAVTTVAVATPAHAASTAGGQITRSEILARAQYWVDPPQEYTYLNSSDTSTWRTGPTGGEKYRRDCSGLISMVWHLPQGYYDTSVYESWIGGPQLTRLASFNDLQPGDAVLRVNFKGLSDHTELFDHWKNPANHGEGAYFYSFNSTGETVRNPYKNSNFQNLGFRSLSDITSNFEHAIHYNNTIDDPGAVPSDDEIGNGALRADFNGDGLGDVAAFYDYPGLRTVLFVWSAKSGGGFNGPVNVWDSGAGGWDQTRSKPVSGDFNGDGRTDVGVFYDYPGLRTVLFTWTAKAGGGFNAPVNVWDSGAGGWDQTR
ncbi:FG-GAP repeat domain-containing protein, partial [Acrocarpospora macrocephala]|uniref:FG-GAP repeat domain-containing protein n=1 Tax=Acrocarpospora macrocephala TaxID=150177 RepID=UPI0014791A19